MMAIDVRGLRKSYAGVTAVDGIDLQIARGECFALLGPNGAGKTTTIEILEGFRSRDSGEVRVLGVDPADGDRSWRTRLGIVGQSIGAALELSVAETVRHFAAYHAAPRDAGELIEAVGLSAKADTRVGKLSGGQRRRLDVALGVQGRPQLLFLDEPTTGLDPRARRRFWTMIEQLRADGTTILLTTHYLDEAAHLADRVGVLAGGRLLETASPESLGLQYRQYATVSWSADGTRREVTTATPTATVRELLADHPHGEVAGLAIHRPDLEDVYLAMLDAAESPTSPSGDQIGVLA
jgi:ABC-2 type transport system ATP-binding protein